MDVKMEASWKAHLEEEFRKPYFEKLTDFVRSEYAEKKVYPPARLIFSAFNHCPFNEVKVVIVGQDPYHEPGQANGLCFSVTDQVAIPPSLQNIYEEIHNDLGKSVPTNGNLERWARQGVLLLNAILTVQAHRAGSHQGKGWEIFTDAVIRHLSREREHLVFMLWGAYAQHKGEAIDTNRHLILKSSHPSPLAAHRGFFGNRHFSKANEYLLTHGMKPIDW